MDTNFLKEAGDSKLFNGPQPSQSSWPTTNFMHVHMHVMTAARNVCAFVLFICAALRPHHHVLYRYNWIGWIIFGVTVWPQLVRMVTFCYQLHNPCSFPAGMYGSMNPTSLLWVFVISFHYFHCARDH